MPATLLIALLAIAPAAVDSTPAARDSLPEQLDTVAVLVTQGDGRGQSLEPSGLAVDPFGRVIVADAALHRLQRFDDHGRWLGESGSLGSDPGQLRQPGSLAMLGGLTVAVLDRENRRVEGYDLFGRRLGTLIDLLDPTLAERVGRVDPVAIAADQGGTIFVADRDGERLVVFDRAARFIKTLGGYGARPGAFRGLAGVAATPRGGVVTAERVNARLQRLDAAGRVVTWWPIAAARGPGALPVAVDDSGSVAVADEASGRLWVFDANGAARAALSGLAGPRALAFAPDGTLLVAEAGNGQVRRFAIRRTTRTTREH